MGWQLLWIVSALLAPTVLGDIKTSVLFPLDECHSYAQETYDIMEGATAITSGVTYVEGPWGNPTGASEFALESYVEIPYLDALDSEGSLSIVLHVYPTSEEESMLVTYLVPDGNGAEEQGLYLQKLNDGLLFHVFERGVANDQTYHLAYAGGNPLTLNAWNYIVATYDYETTKLAVYLNGSLLADETIPQISIKTNGKVRVGTIQDDSRHFVGRLACLRIYSRSMTAEEVAASEECPIPYPLLSEKPSISAVEDGEVIVLSNLTLACTFPTILNASDAHYEVRWYAGPDLDEIYRQKVTKEMQDEDEGTGWGWLTPDVHSDYSIDEMVQCRVYTCFERTCQTIESCPKRSSVVFPDIEFLGESKTTPGEDMVWLRLVLLSALGSSLTIVAEDVRNETKCYGASISLEPDCASSPGLVIFIDWNAKFFGQSCGFGNCCPENTDCAVLVRDTDHFEDQHWNELNDCNGHISCRVQVESIGPGYDCDPSTDYETVTYRCVPAHITATEDTATERQTVQLTTKEVETSSDGSAETVSEPNYPVTQTGGPVHQTTEECQCDCPSNDDVVIAISVSLSLLLVLCTSLVGFICYKRGLVDGAAGNQSSKEVSDQYLTDLSPADSGDTAVQQTNNGQATSTYETIANSYYNDPSPEYTGLQLPQYESLRSHT